VISPVYAERVKSIQVKDKRKPRCDFYEKKTGAIMIALNDYFDDMPDKEWEELNRLITKIFKQTRGIRGVVKTIDQKAIEVTAILKDIVYLNEKEIKIIVTKVMENDK